MTRERGEPLYHRFYCEENVWHLCADPRVGPGPRAVLVISNAARAVACFHHRGATPGFPMVWDYHVVLAVHGLDGWRVWDLDSTLGVDLPLHDWLEGTFAAPPDFPAELAPSFRVIEGSRYRDTLCSDRSHMRAPDGSWSAPPPPWPMIGQGGSNLLTTLVDLHAEGPGDVVDLAGLPAVLATLARDD